MQCIVIDASTAVMSRSSRKADVRTDSGAEALVTEGSTRTAATISRWPQQQRALVTGRRRLTGLVREHALYILRAWLISPLPAR